MSPGVSSASPREERVWELLADRTTCGLTGEESAELRGLLAGAPGFDVEALDRTAAALALAMAPREELPAGLRGRIESSASRVLAPEPLRIEAARPAAAAGRSGGAWRSAGWLVAAGAAVVALAGWWPGRPGPGAPSPRVVGSDQSRAEFERLSRAADGVTLAWGDWAVDGQPPELAGVKGEVVWSDAEQRGVMRFVGLPANERGECQYQLWIIDAERGMEQRISGGVFDSAGGEVLVPIEPRLRVNKAAAFAVTIEKPGGTWVSDMKRRVTIALRG